MRKSILISFIAILLIACGGNTKKNKEQTGETKIESTADASVVNVYYFHGKQRCKTCIAVEEVTKQTVQELFAGNPNVQFVEVNISDKQHEALVEKYEVTWNALIIAKGNNSVELTQQAFANAVNNPEVLSRLITEEVNKRLNN